MRERVIDEGLPLKSSGRGSIQVVFRLNSWADKDNVSLNRYKKRVGYFLSFICNLAICWYSPPVVQIGWNRNRNRTEES